MRTSPKRTQLHSLRDFTGGINLVSDAFKLGDNESPDLLNVDLDRRGGFQVRRGVTPFSNTPLAASPDSIWTFNASGTIHTMAQVGTVVYSSVPSVWTTIGTSLGSATKDVCPVTFNNNCYWARGNADVAKFTGSIASTMGNAFNDTITATSGNVIRANHAAVHAGYMWVASTYEGAGGVNSFPNRIRFSWANTFDNSGENWRTDDFIDIDEGKDFDPITAMVPFGDHLLIFKRDSVYAIYGSSAETFSMVNVSSTVGSVSHAAAIATPAGVFFFDHSSGVNVYTGRNVTNVFGQVLPALRDGDIPRLQTDKVDMGWVNNRLWVSVPWADDPTPPRGVTFVLDPNLKTGGSWTKYSLKLGPYSRGYRTVDSLAYVYGTNLVFKVDVVGQYFDNFGPELGIKPIDAWYQTRWVDLGEPSIKKRWRRTEALMQVDQGYDLPVVSYSDYDPTVTVKSFKFNAVGSSSGVNDAIWDDPDSDWVSPSINPGATKWAKSGVYGYVDRGQTLGIARSVSLKVGGQVLSAAEPGEVQAPVFWGVDALLFKYVPRRVR
jgi:hypothetical protein